MFYIGFTSAARVDGEGRHHATGAITRGGDTDDFTADLGPWSMADYEAQWREGIARLAAGEPSSALVTSYGGPQGALHSMWPMWREGQNVLMHERLILEDGMDGGEIAREFYARVGERQKVGDDGTPVVEWSVPFRDVLAFLTHE